MPTISTQTTGNYGKIRIKKIQKKKDIIVKNSIRPNTYMDYESGKIWFDDDWLSWISQFTYDSNIEELIWNPYYRAKNKILKIPRNYCKMDKYKTRLSYGSSKGICRAMCITSGLPCKNQGTFNSIGSTDKWATPPTKILDTKYRTYERNNYMVGICLCKRHINYPIGDIACEEGYTTTTDNMYAKAHRQKWGSNAGVYLREMRPSEYVLKN